MRSEKQIQASKTNGARSRGPITEQGKRNSSRNSARHGLLSQTVVLNDESAARFQQLLKGPHARAPAALALLGSRGSQLPEILHRYEVSFERQFSRALANLVALKTLPATAQPAGPAPEKKSLRDEPGQDIEIPRRPPRIRPFGTQKRNQNEANIGPTPSKHPIPDQTT